MQEKDFYSYAQLFAQKVVQQSCIIELKLTKKDSFRLSEIAPHQLESLKKASTSFLSYKIPDVGYDKKPCDIVCFHKSPAYLGIVFAPTKKQKALYLIEYKALAAFIKLGDKTISEEQCNAISAFQIQFK